MTVRISSFTILDEILMKFGDKNLYPNLKRIIIAGHSAGGQTTNH